ncbi:ABC transporter permease [Marinobacter sp. 1_MG-2023]|uniref:ABC transporter permease n=1 Tax=Marinobacter sp. 1_MG-2023 TaxID=3062627 RepID=UPI0026E3DF6E|nr:ABC transporter permease [Marinobacter sp. 1_MG-2023]MDO6825474.1 ABC transporter permease [Marinobacter sp. 1_MG-2023]
MKSNRVVQALALAALGCVWLLDLGVVQPNRIVSGTGYGLYASTGWLGTGAVISLLVVVFVLATRPARKRFQVVAVLLTVALMILPLLLEVLALRQLPEDSGYARIGVGAGFWSLAFLLALMLLETLGQLKASRRFQLSTVLLIVAGWWLCASREGLSSLALIREYTNRSDQFFQALTVHLSLSLGAVAISAVLAFALALAMVKRERMRRPLLGLVSFMQTIPSLALFGLLIAPLGALSDAFPFLQTLGIRGIGWAPALLALIAYSLLPMVRNTYVALMEVPESVVDAGRGMGMNERQIFRQVKLPLALPVIIEGVRITTIQAIGLTAVAALIGAGGFGTFIFQGLGQAAMDLVLLGALPTVFLALAADAILSALKFQETSK